MLLNIEDGLGSLEPGCERIRIIKDIKSLQYSRCMICLPFLGARNTIDLIE